MINLTAVYAQDVKRDTINEVELEEVVVKAFEQNRRLMNVPAAVSYVGKQTLERFSPTSVVHAINIMPGVRMEERSPGSYLTYIRGSALRSPFGVRNVKVYFNDLPYTDPGGHTFLNQLGYYNFNSIEIIKGPGSSLYGAGTGGALLIESLAEREVAGAFAEYATGSFNLQNIYGSITTGSEERINKIGFQHQQNEGYRDHSELRRDVLTWSGRYRLKDSSELKTTFLYGDLFYDTPGALTKKEFEENPRAARSGNAFFPGAEAAGAMVHQKTFIAGASYLQHITATLRNKTVLYGAFTQLRNPTVQNFGRSSEPHLGGRTIFTFSPLAIFNINAGAEIQQGFTSFSIHKNVLGNADSLRLYNEVNNRQFFLFTQANLNINNWLFTAGASWNQRKLKYHEFMPRPLPVQIRKFDNKIAPRFSVLKEIKNVVVYSSVSKGFSPPTTEELVPTGGDVNLDLEAEDGTNYDVGFRTNWRRLFIDVNAFAFFLNNTIVLRRTAGGGNYYINGGKTKQYGIETFINYPLFYNSPMIAKSNIWLSHTWHYFRYVDFKQANNDYSGNRLPGVPPHTVSAGFDVQSRKGLLATVTYFLNDEIPLTDANNEYFSAFHLVGAKLGYQMGFNNKWRLKVFAGVENLFDEKYSIGNDINGFGGRYYNAAPGRNYYAAIVVDYKK